MQWCCRTASRSIVVGFAVFMLYLAGCDDTTEYETPKPSRYQETVLGNWDGTGGMSAAFRRDGRFEFDSLMGVCKIYGTYSVSDYSDGTYVVEDITHVVGDCGDKAKTGRGREKLDVLSQNHILIGPAELTRSQ